MNDLILRIALGIFVVAYFIYIVTKPVPVKKRKEAEKPERARNVVDDVAACAMTIIKGNA